MSTERAAAPRRRRPTPALYRRRRLAAGIGAVLGLILLLLAFRSCGGGPEVPELTAAELRQAALDANPVELELSFSGDLLIHSPLYLRAQELAGGDGYDFAPMLAELRPYVAEADLAFCHVETPMTPEPAASYPIFNTPPELAEAIAETGWDACDTASNHTLDQGEEGIGQTIEALERAGVEQTGSATSRRERERALILEAEGVKVAYLAYTSDTNGIPVPRPYSVNLFDPDLIRDDAQRAQRAGADAVIVNLHWASEVAPEYVSEPNHAQRGLVRDLASAPEITAIVGQGPHIAQPIADIEGKKVVFSEGNLISNQGADFGLAAESQDGYVALLGLVVDGDGARVTGATYVPTWTDHSDYRVLPVGDALEAGGADAASLEASYERTVGIVGREAATPEPAKLP